jgi:drug/metabolite transporter (DMT)-like permease
MPDSRRTDLILLLVAIVWGSSYLSAKTATVAIPVLAILFARYVISALACVALVAARRGPRHYTRDAALVAQRRPQIIPKLRGWFRCDPVQQGR